jgi:hypothetical protein
MLGAEAVAGGDGSKSVLVAAVLRDLRVGLCKGAYLMHPVFLDVSVGVSGQGFRPSGSACGGCV